MNREQLSDAIGRLDDSIIEEAMTARRHRRPWWYAAVAVAACVCLAVGMVAVWPQVKPDGAKPQADMDGAVTAVSTTTATKETNRTTHTTKTTHVIDQRPSLVPLYAVAMAQYPQMVQRVDYDENEDEHYAWWESVRERRGQIQNHSDGMTDYYAKTMAQFLSGESGENRVYSPLNAYLALAMLAETAEGDSRAQILDLLGVSDLTALREKCSALWNGVYLNDGAVTSVLANSLWLSDGDRWQYDMDTVKALAEHYYASTFEGAMGSADYNRALQDWINEQTDNLLKEQAGGLEFDPNTVLALASTINYRAKWVNDFDPDDNEEGVFHTANGEVPCTYMTQEGMEMAYLGKNFTAVSLGLDDGAYQMYFFLPDEGVAVDRLITDRQVLQVMQEGTSSPLAEYVLVDMTIPKFDVTSDQDLVSGLKNLGVTDVFDSQKGDFGGILTEQDEPVWVEQARHAARVSVDEEGVTAAAYTVMMLCGTGAPQKTLEFTVDRPFMFAVTGPGETILFTGVVENP